jgi:hypothetical protein
LNSSGLACRAEYMDVFCNPVAKTLDARLRRHDELIPGSNAASMWHTVSGNGSHFMSLNS